MVVEKKLYLWLKSQREYFKEIRKERDNYNWDKDNITLNNKWGNKMTKKDYIKIAKIISDNTILEDYDGNYDTLNKFKLIDDLSVMFKEDNSNFNKLKFVIACEWPSKPYIIPPNKKPSILEGFLFCKHKE